MTTEQDLADVAAITLGRLHEYQSSLSALRSQFQILAETAVRSSVEAGCADRLFAAIGAIDFVLSDGWEVVRYVAQTLPIDREMTT